MENILINIDSRYRDTIAYPNPGNFVYKLPETLKNISYIRLSSIELPSLFYTFSEANNNISFQIVYNNVVHNIVISEGNYDYASIISQIQLKLNLLNNNLNTQFQISWDAISYKVTIQNNTAFNLLFYNDNNHRSLGDRLGFKGTNISYLMNQPTKNDDNNNTIYYWTGESFLDVTKDSYLFLRINDYGVMYNNARANSILAKIILYDQQFVIDTGANFLTKSYEFKQPVNLSKLELELINPLGKTVNMNQMNYSITIECGQIFDKNMYGNKNFQVNKY